MPQAKNRTRLAVAAVLPALLLVGTAASAATNTATDTINACVNATTGVVRIPATGQHCITTGTAAKRERALAWSRQGAAGPTGPTGAQGVSGATGAQGAKGVSGATGARGAQGVRGLPGVVGHDGSDGATGPAGADGQDGTDGATGAPGPAGAAGPAGRTGDTGPAGTPGTLVTKTVSLHGTQALYEQSDWYEATTSTTVAGWNVRAHCVGYTMTDEDHRDYVEASWVGADPGTATPVVLSANRDPRENAQDQPTVYLAAGRDTRTLQAAFSDGSNPLTVVVSRVRDGNNNCLLAMTVSAGS
jgi:hypothetical protein